MLGTHQSAVNHDQLDYYLDEFTFRFNRRRSRHRGMLFYRLLEQAMQTELQPLKTLIAAPSAQIRSIPMIRPDRPAKRIAH